MTAEELKKSILQQAIQGKLVPQNPDEEPASTLLDRIREEKSRLVAEGIIKRDKNESVIYRTDDGRYIERIGKVEKDISSEISFEIPDGWEYCRFSSLIWQISDGTHSTPKYTTSGIPFLSVKDMSSGKLNFENTKFISIEEHNILTSRCKPQEGDLLISKVGSTGIPLIIDTKIDFSIFVSLALVKFFPQFLNSKYLLYLILSPFVQLQVQRDTRGVGNKNWVLKSISNTLMILPPLAEQKRIVEKIEELMPLVEEYGKAKSRLDDLNSSLGDNLCRSVLQYAIQGKLVPQNPEDEPASVLLDRIREEKARLAVEGKIKHDKNESVIYRGIDGNYYERIGKEIKEISDEIPFEIPETWEWTRIRNISQSYIGLTYKPSDVNKDGTIVLRSSNIRNGKINLEDIVRVSTSINDKLWVKKNDIIICARNGSKKLVGKSAIIETIDEPMTFGAFMAICKTPIYKFVYVFLQSSLFFNQLNDVSGTTTINQLTQNNFNNFIIPIPPLAEQKRIVERIEQIFSLCK